MGFFSWRTQDTNKSICNRYSNRPTFKVYMVNPVTMEAFEEDNYDGYGRFGGKDYYSLLAEINGKGSDRNDGIDLAYGEGNSRILYPILVEDISKAGMYVGQKPRTCSSQGYFYED